MPRKWPSASSCISHHRCLFCQSKHLTVVCNQQKHSPSRNWNLHHSSREQPNGQILLYYILTLRPTRTYRCWLLYRKIRGGHSPPHQTFYPTREHKAAIWNWYDVPSLVWRFNVECKTEGYGHSKLHHWEMRKALLMRWLYGPFQCLCVTYEDKWRHRCI